MTDNCLRTCALSLPCQWYTFRNKADSTNESTRHGRDKGASRVYPLRNTTRLPPQKVMLTVTRNRVQLIDLICEDMAFHKDDFSQHRLVLTGSDPVPVEINRGVIIKLQYMKTTQEGADTMIVQQVAEVKAKKVLVVADDTDIVVLLLHFCCQGGIPASTSTLMVSPNRGRAVIDINATVDLHRDIIPDLSAAHGLTGCDTVATYFGIGKAAALRPERNRVPVFTPVPLRPVVPERADHLAMWSQWNGSGTVPFGSVVWTHNWTRSGRDSLAHGVVMKNMQYIFP